MQNLSFNIQRVHKINLFMTIGLVFLIVTPLLFMKGFAASFIYIVAGFLIISLSTINYFLKIPDAIKGFIFAFLPALVIVALFILDGFQINKHYILLFTVLMVALYFNKRLLTAYGIFMLLSVTLLYVMAPSNFLGDNTKFSIYITVLAVYIGVTIVLYFMTSWSEQLILDASTQQQQAIALSEKLTETLKQVAQIAEETTTSTNTIVDLIQHDNKTIHEITTATQQISKLSAELYELTVKK